MSLCYRSIWSPLTWLFILLVLGINKPIIAADPDLPVMEVEEVVGTRSVDFSPLVTMARVAGTFSIIVAVIWSTGLVVSARLHSGRRKAPTCGDQ